MAFVFAPQTPCTLCPRNCGIIRTPESGNGFCGMGTDVVIARAALHLWEEPCISGTRGTGAVFFSGCTLRCAYCQNRGISHGGFGKRLSARQLADVFKRLVEEEGAQTLSLITPTQFLPAIMSALEMYRPSVPIVYNSGGYEKKETLWALEGLVDVWLPDMKHVSSRLSLLFSDAADYFLFASEALQEMYRQSGPPQYDGEGIMTRGTLVRHLILPGCTTDSIRALQFIKDSLPEGTPVSLMGQYTPQAECGIPDISRRITKKEYKRVENFMHALELPGYIQGLDAADEAYTPAFDLSGL